MGGAEEGRSRGRGEMRRGGAERIVGEEVPTLQSEKNGIAAGGGTIDVMVQLYRYRCVCNMLREYLVCKYILKLDYISMSKSLHVS